MYCTYYSMPKGTSQAEAMSNSEKIKLIALAEIKLCFRHRCIRCSNRAAETE